MTLRVAVIGAGGIAERHVANLEWLPGARLVGVADPVLEAAEGRARGTAGAQAFSDWRKMLEAVKPDALLICVPPFAHGEPELAAADLGLPFFVEKPVAADLGTAEKIGAAIASSGIVTAVGYHWRYLDTTERAAELLDMRPAELVVGYWWDATPPRAWWVRQTMSGGQMVEQTTHLFDLARHLIGEATIVSAIARRSPDREVEFAGSDVADASIASVMFETGAIGSFISTHLLRWPHRIGLHLVSEGQVLELSERELMVDVGQGRPITPAVRDPFREELRDFVVAAGGGENRIRVPFAEALKTHRLTVAATELTTSGGRAGMDNHGPAPTIVRPAADAASAPPPATRSR